jgi:hypothetical protein
MTNVSKPNLRPEHADKVCNVCGKPSTDTICETCATWLRAEALDRKKHEEKPNS